MSRNYRSGHRSVSEYQLPVLCRPREHSTRIADLAGIEPEHVEAAVGVLRLGCTATDRPSTNAAGSVFRSMRGVSFGRIILDDVATAIDEGLGSLRSDRVMSAWIGLKRLHEAYMSLLIGSSDSTSMKDTLLSIMEIELELEVPEDYKGGVISIELD